MTLSAIKHPVELLRDGKGIYGIGVNKEAEIDRPPRDLILRRDRLPKFEMYLSGYPVLQMITGGFRHGMFCNTLEDQLRQVIHHGMLRRAGLAWPPPQSTDTNDVRYWSSDPRQQARNRQIYHGLRLKSLSVINRLIGQALEEAADQETVKVARRFKFRHRYNIYRATALSPRALQLAVSFPALAFVLFADDYLMHEPINAETNHEFGKQIAEQKRIRHDALSSYLGPDVVLTTVLDAKSVWTDPNDPWISEVFQVARSIETGDNNIGAAPYFTDASALTAALGSPPTVIIGPGELELAHQTDEYCLVSRVENAAEIYSELIRRWCWL